MTIFFILLILLVPLGIIYFIIFHKKNESNTTYESVLIDSFIYDKYLIRSINSLLNIDSELVNFKEIHEIMGNRIGIESRFRIDGFEIIKFSGTTSCYAYHNFVSWMDNDGNVSLGFARSRKSAADDYLFFSDSSISEGDTQVGSFRNGKCFSVFLPDLLTEDKMRINTDFKVSFEEIYNNFALGNIDK